MKQIKFLVLCGVVVFLSSCGKQSKEYSVNGVSFKMIYVEGGSFLMGSDGGGYGESPVHKVTLDSYYMGELEVSQALWEAVMGRNSSDTQLATLPVVWVTWNDCQEFVGRLNELTGCKFLLPTEAQWEFAARGGRHSKNYSYAGGNELEDVAWCIDNSGNKTHSVGKKQPNELGLYDMSGNVWEWCQDWFVSSYYSSSPECNLQGLDRGRFRAFDRNGVV